MKILFWTDGFWPRIGGIETQGLRFLEEMIKRGHQCRVLAQKDLPDAPNATPSGIPIERFDLNQTVTTKGMQHLQPINEHIEWIAKEFRPDIIHLNTYMGWSAFIFLLFQMKLRAPIILTAHAPLIFGFECKARIERLFSLTDQICCVSNWVLQELQSLFPAAKHKFQLIYNGLPMPEQTPSPLSFSPPILLLLGRFTAEKGFDTAIEAFAILKKTTPSAKLLIAGDGEERTSWQNLVLTLGLAESVQFTGELTKEAIPSIINRATLVIVPSHFESFGLVALEAMQMRRPVIASAVGGLKELVVDGQTGLLVPPQDPNALCKAVQFLLDHPEKATLMGIRGQERAMRQFTLEQNATQYEKSYERIVLD